MSLQRGGECQLATTNDTRAHHQCRWRSRLRKRFDEQRNQEQQNTPSSNRGHRQQRLRRRHLHECNTSIIEALEFDAEAGDVAILRCRESTAAARFCALSQLPPQCTPIAGDCSGNVFSTAPEQAQCLLRCGIDSRGFNVDVVALCVPEAGFVFSPSRRADVLSSANVVQRTTSSNAQANATDICDAPFLACPFSEQCREFACRRLPGVATQGRSHQCLQIRSPEETLCATDSIDEKGNLRDFECLRGLCVESKALRGRQVWRWLVPTTWMIVLVLFLAFAVRANIRLHQQQLALLAGSREAFTTPLGKRSKRQRRHKRTKRRVRGGGQKGSAASAMKTASGRLPTEGTVKSVSSE
ncbi:MAG: hypothetical protein MHM6MM_007133 [Cercozoa sp. M6MM]